MNGPESVDNLTIQTAVDEMGKELAYQVEETYKPMFPEEPEELQIPRFRKSQRRAEYTHYESPYRLAQVNLCGHMIDLDREMTGNCLQCWFTWFNHHQNVVEMTMNMYKQHGEQTIIATRGLKFWKYYRKFMAAVGALAQEAPVV